MTNTSQFQKSQADMERAKFLLKQNSVNPDGLSPAQLTAFATTTPAAQAKSLEIYMRNLNMQEDIDMHDNSEITDMKGSKQSSEETSQEELVTPEQLVNKCKELLAELDEFGKAVAESKTGKLVNYATFRNEVQSEMRSLEKLAITDQSSGSIQHHLKSCNLPYYEALWAAAKRSSEIVRFRKWFYWDDKPTKPTAKKAKKGAQHKTKGAALVDLESRNGEEWTKVSTITDKRLLFDLAKQGWRNEESEDSDDDMSDGRSTASEDDEDEISLVRIAKELARAADANPSRTKRPQVRFILPRIQPGCVKEVQRILDNVRATGAIVECGKQLSSVLPLKDVLPKLLIDRFRGFSHVLNVDCTILLALVSDISHADVTPELWFPKQAIQQILDEKKERLLETSVYPAMANHPLVCTVEAALRMREIVDIIGTDTEKARTAILLDDNKERTREQLLEDFKKLSRYPVPDHWQLPIRTVSGPDMNVSKLPPVAHAVAAELSELNRSVFMYGWASGQTTLSSNGTVSKQIERLVVEKRTSPNEFGPHIWHCSVPRSLIAKKGRGDIGTN